MDGLSLVPDRLVVAGAVLLTGLLFVKDASDPVNIVKLSALLLCALTVAVLAVSRVARERVLRLPSGAPAWVAVGLLAALTLAAVVAPHTPTALYGTYGRNSGLFAYAAALLLYVVVLRVFDAASTKVVAFGFVLAALVTASYGLCQYRGIDAVGWNNPFNPIIAALGNPDFAAAYIAIGVPVTVWAACWPGWSTAWRVLSGGAALLMLVVAVLSDAVQGPIAAAAGLVVLGLAWALGQSGQARRLSLGGVAGVSALGLLVLAAGAAGTGPGKVAFEGISYRARTWYWEGALHMFQRSPVWGVGLDSYGIRWRQERPVASVRELGGDHFSDAAHSVPLQMLAQGGLVLGLAYLAFVGVTAYCLVKGLLRLRGQERLLLGALGGSWVAYQVQSLISIDQIPLLVAHFVLAGAVVVASGQARLHEVRLPGALVTTAPTGRRRGAPLLRTRQVTPGDYAVIGIAGVLALVLAWQSVTPLRAARASFAGDAALPTGNGTLALADYDRAADLDSHSALYLTKKGQLYNQADQLPKALEAYQEAATRDPFDLGALRTTGRLADNQQDFPKAERFFRRAALLDPLNSGTVLDLTQFQLRHGQAAAARSRLEALVGQLPSDGGLWATLGDARLVSKDCPGARTAYQQALALDAGQAVAKAGLGKLSPGC